MFRLRSTWHLQAPPAQVWAVMSDVAGWPGWWPGLARTEVVRHGDDAGRGLRVRVVVRSPLGYALRFGVEVVEAEPPARARARVVGGLVGEGEWSVAADGSVTTATIRWDVQPTGRFLGAVTGPLRVPLTWAHGRVMAAGERALARRLAEGRPG